MRSERFRFRLSPREKGLLALVSEEEERTASDVLRRLIRQEAKYCGLIGDISNVQPEENIGEALQ